MEIFSVVNTIEKQQERFNNELIRLVLKKASK